MIDINIAIFKLCIEKRLFSMHLNVITVIADFICSGILFQIGTLSECRVMLGTYDFFIGCDKLHRDS